MEEPPSTRRARGCWLPGSFDGELSRVAGCAGEADGLVGAVLNRVVEVGVEGEADGEAAIGVKAGVGTTGEEAEAAHVVGGDEGFGRDEDGDFGSVEREEPGVGHDRGSLAGVMEPLVAVETPAVVNVLSEGDQLHFVRWGRQVWATEFQDVEGDEGDEQGQR